MAGSVAWIDISDLGKRTTRAFMPLMLARVFILFVGGLVLTLIWAVAVFLIIDRMGARGPLEAVSIIIGLPIAAGPFLYAGYWVFRA